MTFKDAESIFANSTSLTSFEQDVLNNTFYRLSKKKPTLKGRTMTEPTRNNEILIDKPTQDRIALLHPKIRQEIEAIIKEANTVLTGRASVRISQGLRTIAEQNALYAQGRTDKTKKIVTNAKGGSSFHNYGLAVDIVLILDGKTASWDDKTDFDGDKASDWMEVVAIFKKYGYGWGGDFRSIKDSPHFEKSFGYTTSQLLAKVNKKDFINGTTYVNL